MRQLLTRRHVGLLLLGAGACAIAGPFVLRSKAQEATPNRRELTIAARNYQFSPTRVEVTQDDIVKLTLSSSDQTHSFTIDEYRIVRRIPAGGHTTFEFRADRVGTYRFYCNLTSDDGCRQMHGELIVVPKK